MNVHNLKIRPNYFKDVIAEIKKIEIRFNDRGFEVGDLIVLGIKLRLDIGAYL